MAFANTKAGNQLEQIRPSISSRVLIRLAIFPSQIRPGQLSTLRRK